MPLSDSIDRSGSEKAQSNILLPFQTQKSSGEPGHEFGSLRNCGLVWTDGVSFKPGVSDQLRIRQTFRELPMQSQRL